MSNENRINTIVKSIIVIALITVLVFIFRKRKFVLLGIVGILFIILISILFITKATLIPDLNRQE